MIFYLVIALFATIIGGISGLGGGIIIKPLLSLFTEQTSISINFLSACTVFFMAIITCYKHYKKGNLTFEIEYVYLIIGSLIGGYLGSSLFEKATTYFPSTELISKIQSIILIIFLIFILYSQYAKYQILIKKKAINLIICAILMGVIASFLGIGGGPINMLILMKFLNYDIKKSTILSMLTILFSQIISIITILSLNNIQKLDINFLPYMLIGAFFGSLIGNMIFYKLTTNATKKFYCIVLYMILFMNILIVIQ